MLWWSCRRKLGWVDPFLPLSSVLSPCSVISDVTCHLAPGASCRVNSCQSYSSMAQPSNSSSAVYSVYIPPGSSVLWIVSRSTACRQPARSRVRQTCISQDLGMVCKSKGLLPERKQVLEVYRHVCSVLHLSSNEPPTLDLSLYSWHTTLQPG